MGEVGLNTAFDIHELPAPDCAAHLPAAAVDLLELSKKFPNAQWLLIVLPVVMLRIEAHDEALRIATSWTESHPLCTLAYLCRGRLLAWMHRYPAAIEAHTQGEHFCVCKRNQEIPLNWGTQQLYHLICIFMHNTHGYLSSSTANKAPRKRD